MSPNEWDNCFLLHQRAYGETSIIADIFTRSSGKISVIARGAKKPKSKFFGYLAPFCKLKVTYSGRSELKTLTNIDRDFSMSVDNFSKTSYSLLYINELLTKLLPKNATHEELFDLYEGFLEKVKSNDLELTLRSFELDMLEMLGYGIDFESDIDEHIPIEANAYYKFISQRGFRKSERGELLGQEILDIRDRKLESIPRKSLKKITKEAILLCLDGKELASREIFRSLKG